jgi:hypothetical protein
MPRLSLHMERNIRWDLNDAKLPKSFKRHSKTIYKAFTPLHSISFYVNIDHVSLGKQSIANKYAPINTQNRGFIRENIELNTLSTECFNKIGKSTTQYFTRTAVQISINIHASWFWLNKCFTEYNTQQQFSEDSAFSCWYIELNPRLCRWVSFERNIYRLLTFKSLISNVQPGLINNYVPFHFMKNICQLKLRFMVLVVLCVALFTLLVLFWTRSPHLPSLPPISPNCYLPKSGRHLTSLDQGLSSRVNPALFTF